MKKMMIVLLVLVVWVMMPGIARANEINGKQVRLEKRNDNTWAIISGKEINLGNRIFENYKISDYDFGKDGLPEIIILFNQTCNRFILKEMIIIKDNMIVFDTQKFIANDCMTLYKHLYSLYEKECKQKHTFPEPFCLGTMAYETSIENSQVVIYIKFGGYGEGLYFIYDWDKIKNKFKLMKFINRTHYKV